MLSKSNKIDQIILSIVEKYKQFITGVMLSSGILLRQVNCLSRGIDRVPICGLTDGNILVILHGFKLVKVRIIFEISYDYISGYNIERLRILLIIKWKRNPIRIEFFIRRMNFQSESDFSLILYLGKDFKSTILWNIALVISKKKKKSLLLLTKFTYTVQRWH